jgi:hypothetical protein
MLDNVKRSQNIAFPSLTQDQRPGTQQGPFSQNFLRQNFEIFVTLRWICEAITHKK